uniref:Uncharacterized protein n=1 Tax=Arundo donax TaxID=35708 RepID=A0A0A9GU31_ARUDO
MYADKQSCCNKTALYLHTVLMHVGEKIIKIVVNLFFLSPFFF